MLDITKKTLKDLNTVYQKWKDFDFVAERERIIKTSNKKLMSKSTCSMFYPDQKILGIHSYIRGKLTNREKSRTFTYYFDDKDRLLLTEHYDPKYTSEIIALYFYFYLDDLIECVSISVYWHDDIKKSNINEYNIYEVGFMEHQNSNVSRFVEGGFATGGVSFFDYTFVEGEDYVIRRFYFPPYQETAFPHLGMIEEKEIETEEKIPLIKACNISPERPLSRIMKTPNKHLDYLKTSIKENMSIDEIIDIFQSMCKMRAKDTDILFETGVYSFSGPKIFYFSLSRQYPGIDGEYLQLQVNIEFRPTKKNITLQESIWDFEAEPNIFEYIRQSESYLWAKKAKIKKIDISLNET